MSSDQSGAIGLAELVGQNMRAIREEIGMSQDWIAARLRQFGLDWNASQVAKVERGSRRDLTVEQLALIATAFDVPVTRLVDGDPGTSVRLSPQATTTVAFLARVLTDRDDNDVRSRIKARSLEAFDAPYTRRVRSGSGRAHSSASETEQRLARTLGVPPETVVDAALSLWGHSFIQEREQRLADRVGVDISEVYVPPIEDLEAFPTSADRRGHQQLAREILAHGQSWHGLEPATVSAIRGRISRELSAELQEAMDAPPTRRRRKKQ